VTNIILVGGENSDNYTKGEAWGAYKAGLIISVDLNSGEKSILVRDDKRPSYIEAEKEIGVVYKAATIVGGVAYVCSTTEIIIYDARTWVELERITSPLFNDVHHVTVGKDGGLLIANTGLDCVLEIDFTGEVIKWYPTYSGQEESYYDRNIDFRKIPSTKPHISHPNFVFMIGSDVYTTRFKQKDGICLTDPGKYSYQVEAGNIHDGLVSNGLLYFTSTNGWITVFDIASGLRKQEINLNDIYQSKLPLGWCRGLEILDGNRLVVGFSRLRPTKFRENVDWVSKAVGYNKKMSPLPSRIAVLDLEKLIILNEFNMESLGMNAIFSIHNAC